MNIYDVRLVDDWPACGMNWPPDLIDVYSFLRRKDVIAALHATKKETAWVECDGRVSSELHMQKSPAAVAFLPDILERGVKVLMFAGAEDLICNYKGIERIIDHLDWSGATGFANSTEALGWYVNDTQVGTWQTDRNMSYAKIFSSSHMVGFDVPHVTNDMILRFMDVDFSLLPGQAASSKSRIGDDDRVVIGFGTGGSTGMPLFKGGNSRQDAWYNAGSAVLFLLVMASLIALFLYFRRRGYARLPLRRGVNLREDGDAIDAAERVPLGSERVELDDMDGYELDGEGRKRRVDRKGKKRAVEDEERAETVFALGDEDEDKER